MSDEKRKVDTLNPDGDRVDEISILKGECDALAARLAEAERRATTLQADLDRAIESALKANAINTDWRRDWKAAIARAEAAEARVRELVECVKHSTEYRQGNPAFESAVSRATDSARAVQCSCGEPNDPDAVHRTDGPCYMAEPLASQVKASAKEPQP